MNIDISDVTCEIESLLENVVEDVVREKLEGQECRVLCQKCAAEMEFIKEVGDDGDLTIDVRPCQCQKGGDS